MNLALTDAGVTARRPARTPPDERLIAPIPMGRAAGLRKPSWWLWPHLLSLDAPLVAFVWQCWWARRTETSLPPSREVILVLGVWLIYLVDRLADTAGNERRVCGATRHLFSSVHRKFLLPLAATIALTLAGVSLCCLPFTEFRAGLVLLALATGHFWLTHAWPGRGWAAFVPKEAVVGALFSLGSAFFVARRAAHLAGGFWSGIVLFGTLCFLNCALITRWERHAEDLREPSSLLNAFPRFSVRLGSACLLLAAVAMVSRSVLAVPIALSALSLAALDRCKNRVSLDALRVLADVVLLTPVLLLL